jgi:RimJ/RimL family protein N-acetyltransferase
MTSLWRHIDYNYREGGLRQILYKVVCRVRRPLWTESNWLVYRCDLAGYLAQSRLPLIRRELGLESLLKYEYYKAEAFPEAVHARLNSGSRCHGFFLEDRLVNVGWTSKGMLELEAGLTLSEVDHVYNYVGVYDCYTVPEYRSRGIYRDALTQLLGMIRDEGGQVALIAVDPENHASIKGIERAGFTPLYCLRRRRRLGASLVQRSEFQPYCGTARNLR